jgi:hypothetical protein
MFGEAAWIPTAGTAAALIGLLSLQSAVHLEARPDEKTIAERWNQELGLTSEYLDLEKGAFMFTKKS